MLEVGQIMTADGKQLDLPWNRAHFGAWCTVSSPLVLGMDLSSPAVDAVLPIITNPEVSANDNIASDVSLRWAVSHNWRSLLQAIRVNQQYAGHPGMLLKSAPDPDAPQPDGNGFLVSVGALPTDANGKAWGPMELTLRGAAEWCNRHQRRGEVRPLHRLLSW